MQQITGVAIGGALGSILRYLCNIYLAGSTLPLATLTVNILGCFLMGFITNGVAKYAISPTLLLALTTGFLGGLTTFSAFGLEAFIFLKTKQLIWASFIICANVILGITALAVGHFAGSKIFVN